MKFETSAVDAMSQSSNNSDEFSSNDDSCSQNSQLSPSTAVSASMEFANCVTSTMLNGSAPLLAASNTFNFIQSLDGLNSGVPTRTTPTLTPTTLRNIEQTFIELQSKPQSHENEAGFVPPLVHSIGNNQYVPASEADIYTTVSGTNKSTTYWNSSLSQCSSEDSNTSPLPADLQNNSSSSSSMQTSPAKQRRNMGGRKPNKDENITPEEEERRKIRRERNKAAAARCRKRRVDHTNQLVEETEDLERKKSELQRELSTLKNEADELQYLLDQHRQDCSFRLLHHISDSPRANSPLNGNKPYISQSAPYVQEDLMQHRIKTEIDDIDYDPDYFPSPNKKIMLNGSLPVITAKPNRPNSLDVRSASPAFHNNNNNTLKNFGNGDLISISTPSTGIQFNFDSLMVGGTGLTPVAGPLVPNCSAQQRIPTSSCEISTPESCNPPKLVSL